MRPPQPQLIAVLHQADGCGAAPKAWNQQRELLQMAGRGRRHGCTHDLQPTSGPRAGKPDRILGWTGAGRAI